MKVKIKITVHQFHYLVYYVQGCTYEGLNELQVLNIRLFLPVALKKVIDTASQLGYFGDTKVKTFPIEINQFTAIMELLTYQRNYLDPYTLALFITLQNQHKPLLNLS